MGSHSYQARIPLGSLTTRLAQVMAVWMLSVRSAEQEESRRGNLESVADTEHYQRLFQQESCVFHSLGSRPQTCMLHLTTY